MANILKDIRDSIVTIAVGMGITFKHLGKRPVTQQYPDERWSLPDRFRGFVHNDVPRCTACLACAKDCPVDCIYIETVGKGKERLMSRFAIDYNKCIWCSLCTEHCPTDCITMSHDYDHAVYKRQRLVYEFVEGEPVVPFKPPRPEKPTPPAAAKPAAGAADEGGSNS
jgi:NADH-quinone oxidoreductase chain I